MMRTILAPAIGVFLVSAAMMPAVAAATERDDILDLSATFKALGYSQEASQMEQVLNGLSDADLQVLKDLNFAEINAKVNDYVQMKSALDAAVADVPVQPSFDATISGATQRAYDLSTFPVPNYPPQSSTCPNAVGTVNTAALKVGLKATFFALREALTAAEGVQRAALPACNAIVIAIGVGGNAASACVVSAVALSVADGLLVGAENVVDNLIFCDEQVHFAESAASDARGAYLAHQLETHDADLAAQLTTHDTQVQAKLQDAIARAAALENKLDLALKTQIELAMDRKTRSAPAVLYQDRLAELCDDAQEAIDDLPPQYALESAAPGYVSDGKQFEGTDPKRAVQYCVRGYQLATRGSDQLP